MSAGIYRDFIVELYKNPLNKRIIKNATATASGANPACGDHLRIYAKIKNGKIADVSFEGQGCAIMIASASLLTENAKGKFLKEIKKWNSKNIFKWLGPELGPSRIKCGLLALETLQKSFT